jgi:hypothetical protein
MVDWTTFGQKVYGRLVSRETFAFRPEVYDNDGLRPARPAGGQRRWGRRLGDEAVFAAIRGGAGSRAYP